MAQNSRPDYDLPMTGSEGLPGGEGAMTRTLDAEVAVPAQCELAEGPVWDAARGLLRWVDILPGHVHALDPVTGGHSSFEVGDPVGTVGLTRGGGLVLALVDGFALAGHDGQDLRRLGDFTVDRSVVRFNDGKPDPWGDFWAGTMAWQDESGPPVQPVPAQPGWRGHRVVRRRRAVQRPGLDR